MSLRADLFVGEFAIAPVPMPVPVVMHEVVLEWASRGGALP